MGPWKHAWGWLSTQPWFNSLPNSMKRIIKVVNCSYPQEAGIINFRVAILILISRKVVMPGLSPVEILIALKVYNIKKQIWTMFPLKFNSIQTVKAYRILFNIKIKWKMKNRRLKNSRNYWAKYFLKPKCKTRHKVSCERTYFEFLLEVQL